MDLVLESGGQGPGQKVVAAAKSVESLPLNEWRQVGRKVLQGRGGVRSLAEPEGPGQQLQGLARNPLPAQEFVERALVVVLRRIEPPIGKAGVTDLFERRGDVSMPSSLRYWTCLAN